MDLTKAEYCQQPSSESLAPAGALVSSGLSNEVVPF